MEIEVYFDSDITVSVDPTAPDWQATAAGWYNSKLDMTVFPDDSVLYQAHTATNSKLYHAIKEAKTNHWKAVFEAPCLHTK